MNVEQLIQPFCKISRFLVERIPYKGWNGKSEKGKKLCEELKALSPAGEEIQIQEFYARCLGMALAVLVLGGLFLGSVLTAAWFLKEDSSRVVVSRPGYGEGGKETELEVWMEGESEKEKISFSVSERKYTEEQVEALFAKIQESMEITVKGSNQSLDNVRENLNFPESFENGTIKATWETTPSGFLDDTGKILKEAGQRGQLIEIQGTLACQGKEAVWQGYAKLYPGKKTPKEERQEAIQEALNEADASGAEAETMILPEEIEDQKLLWKEPEETSVWIFPVMLLICAAAVYQKGEQKVNEEFQKRRRQMIMDYPGLLYKMAMLLGAGLTIQGTFFRIGREYVQRKRKAREEKQKVEVRYVYEEILETCFEMRNGVGEARAYENFGSRCQIEAYRKLGSLLAQNLKKGSKGLIHILETEAAEGMEERKQQAKKLGEEAGTKLLIPMMMMLVLVMGILVIPSVVGMQQ